MRLKDRVAIVVGGGQTPGETIGNGRATAIAFAREGAKVWVVDARLDSADETVALIKEAGGTARSFAADVTDESQCEALAAACKLAYGRIDILHNNVGKSQGDAMAIDLTEDNWNSIFDLNLKSIYLTCKHTLPTMRAQESGCIINISSIASLCTVTSLAYKTSKSGVNSLTQLLAVENGRYGIRVNSILPGLMDTPMAIERRARERNVDRDVIRSERNKAVPLRRKMGTGWDVAHAAVFLASDEASFISGVNLPVDGAQSAKVG